ncbi:MAG: hypothetical protein VKP72_00030 [bacterium]|nr:hypothetical protein [bacterium]
MWAGTAWTNRAIALLALPLWAGVSGCGRNLPGAVSPVPATGSVQFSVPLEGRSIQVVASQVKSVRVTLTGHTGKSTEKRNLRSSVAGRALTFETLHLPAGTYTLKVAAFLDQAETLPCGEVNGSPFHVSANSKTLLTLPSLKLDPTPLGEWKIGLSMPRDAGDRIENYAYTLVLGDGTTVTTNRSTPLTSWGNVPVWPSATCTTVLKVTARRHGDTYVTTASVTATVKANSLTTSTLAIWPAGVPWESEAVR